jgi:iron complex outermembrane recepter protein
MKISRHLLFCTVAIPLFAGARATAQVADGAVNDITVVGQRQQYRGDVPIKDLPQAVQVVPAETLRELGITRLDDALDFVSGVSRQNDFGGMFNSFAVRGFAGDESSATNYLVNGFNAARGYGGMRDASNIERIEILKGPTSALFGRGEPGGTVNVITKKPTFETVGSFTLSGGSYNTWRGEADVNVAVTPQFAARITGAYERGDSFRDTIDYNKWTVTPSFLAKLGENTTVTYELEHIRQSVPFDRGIVAVNGNLNVLPIGRFLGDPGNGHMQVDATGHQLQAQHNFNSIWSLLVGFGYRETSMIGASSEAELTASRQKLYVDGQTLSRQRRYRDYSTTDTTARAELNGKFDTFGFTHHLLVGADWDAYDINTIQRRFRPPAVAAQTTLAAGNAINIFAPVYGFLPPVGNFQDQQERQRSWGVYLQDQIDITDKVKLRVGGRYDEFDQTIDDHLSRITTKQNRTSFSPQIGLAYLPVENVTLYASYGRGFRPNTGVTFDNQAFAPEKTTSYEIGAKVSLFDDQVTSSVALFKTRKSNVLTADPVNAGFSLAVGRAESQGVEFDLTAKLPWEMRAQVTYAYLDAEVGKDALDPNFGLALHKGDPLINIPKNSASLILFKDFLVNSRKLTVGGGVNYVGKRLGETGFRFPDGSFFYLPSYTTVRLDASYMLLDNLRVSMQVNNLFNERYYPSSYSRLWVTPGTPRSFMARMSYIF